jgi:hypothetical protein
MEAKARRSLERDIGNGWRHADMSVIGIPYDVSLVHPASGLSVIASTAPHPETPDVEWVHASIANRDGRTPTYDELKALHAAVFGDRWAYQVFAPPGRHVNIHANALHLWGRADGINALPDFGYLGTI